MKHLKISSDNKDYIVERYSSFMLSRMNDLEILEAFRDYFHKEKMSYPNETLEQEINRFCPAVLEDHIAEEVLGKGAEYAKAI
jgi:hypothetical protein